MSEEKRIGKIFAKVEEIIGFDLRSLAVFRLGLALIVIADLLSRFRGLVAHYTDQGVLPRHVAASELLRPWYWSIHLISGEIWVQFLLFLIAFLCALAMLLGYRTRLATIATWIFNISIQNRNLALIFAGDDVLRAILFWAMFLPLGACYSIDSALNSSTKALPKRFASGATFAFMLQLCFIYIWSAAYKTKSPIWFPNGEAVYYSLSFDQYVTGLGQLLLSFPPIILKIITFAALSFEWVGPLIIFIPFKNTFFRYFAIISFILLHLGFKLSFQIGVLSELSIVNWLILIPSHFWDNLNQKIKTKEREGLTIYYDAECGFCKKAVHLIRTFLILPGTPLLLAQENESIYADMVEKNSWVVVDWQNNRHFKFEGIIYVISLSPILWFLVPLLRLTPIMTIGTKFYETIASNRRTVGIFTRPLKFRPLEIKSGLTIITLIILFLTTIWNLKSFVDQTVFRRKEQPNDWISKTHELFNKKTFQYINILGYITRLDQSWSIFAPAPPRDDGWHVVVGRLKNGSEVDVLQNSKVINWQKPTVEQRTKLYQTIQWRVYFINLNREFGNKLLPYFAQYLCREWNAIHPGDQQLVGLEIYFLDERTVPPGEKQIIKKTRVWQQSC